MNALIQDQMIPLLRRVALVLSLVIASALPGGYFTLKHANLVEQVQVTAEIKAQALTELIAGNPEIWRYQLQRVEELLRHQLVHLNDNRAIVYDGADTVLLALGPVSSGPVVSGVAPIYDSGHVLGKVVVIHSALQLWFGTALAGLAGAVLGALTYLTLLLVPVRALRRANVELQRERAELIANEERFRRLNELSADWIWERDAERRLTYLSPSYFELTGGRLEDMSGKTPEEFTIATGERHQHNYDALLRANRSFRDHEYARQDPDGQIRWRSISGEPVFNRAGQLTGYRGTGKNVSERKEHEEELLRRASHDELTGLPNRASLRDRIGHAIERSGRAGETVAVLLLDLDEFKHINDSLGHEVGDTVLRQVAERLLACVRAEDTVARLGGDEFVVVVSEPAGPDPAQEVASRILETLGRPIEVDGREALLSASIGVSVCPRDGSDAAILIRNADAAMYAAKLGGGNAIHFYTSELNERATRYVAVRGELHHALEANAFELYYQPIVDGLEGWIVGAEALIRWHRADGTLVLPADFIDVAEDTGLIVPIGEWVLRTACAQAMTWRIGGQEPPTISVNLSARQFRDGNLVTMVRAALFESGLPPQRLVLEITESTMMNDLEMTTSALEQIEALGVAVAIDDFGTGYSSLAYLKRFPVSELKVDRSFVRDAVNNADDKTIVRAVVDLAHALGLRVVAEGVETGAQIALLREMGCDWLQGFGLGRPMPAAEFAQLLAAGPLDLYHGERESQHEIASDFLLQVI